MQAIGKRPVRILVIALSIAAPLVLGRSAKGSAWSSSSLPAATQVKRSSSPIAITADGSTLLIVNPDSNSVSLVDTVGFATVEVPVGIDPRSVAIAPDDAIAYVANQGSDSITVVDVGSRAAVEEISVGDRPIGAAVSPCGEFLAVAELGEDRVRLLDTASLATVALIPVGDRPHGLAFSPGSDRLLVTHLLSGEVTVVTLRPYVVYLPLVTRGQGSASAGLVSVQRRGFVVGDSAAIPTWPNVAPAPSVVVNSAGTRAYVPQTMAHGQGLNTQFDTTVFPKVSVIDLRTGSHLVAEHISLPERDQPVALPWDVALARDGTELWVVNAASKDVSVLDISDATRPRRVAHILVGDNPRGIVIDPNGSTAYVNNVLAGTVTVIDAYSYAVTRVITVTAIPLPPILLRGKRLFHSSARADLAKAAWISCNTCHIGGEQDGRTWLLQHTGDVPPGARSVITRNTTSLLGMIETYPLRWSAEWDESADSEFSIRFEQFGRGLIDGEMHPTLDRPNQGRSYDLDCLASFIDSLAAPACRHELDSSSLRGKAVFESQTTGCATCHPAPLYTDHRAHDVGTAGAYGEWFGPLVDTPTLRSLYDSSPYLHDGSAPTLRDVLTGANPDDRHGVTSHLTEEQIEDLIAFLAVLPYCE